MWQLALHRHCRVPAGFNRRGLSPTSCACHFPSPFVFAHFLLVVWGAQQLPLLLTLPHAEATACRPPFQSCPGVGGHMYDGTGDKSLACSSVWWLRVKRHPVLWEKLMGQCGSQEWPHEFSKPSSRIRWLTFQWGHRGTTAGATRGFPDTLPEVLSAHVTTAWGRPQH